jgi:hypothetical protein
MPRHNIRDGDDDDYDAALFDPQLDHRPSDRTTDHRLPPPPDGEAVPPGLLFPSPFAEDDIDHAAIAALVAQLTPDDDLSLALKTICTELFDGTQDPAELQRAVEVELKRRFG